MDSNLKKEIKKLQRVKKGDIFANSWGYDQTNVDFWKVVGKTPKSVKVRQLKTQLKETGFMCGDATPSKTFRDKAKKPVTKRLNFDRDGKVNLRMDYGWCDLWDKKPARASWYG